ncbi:MAG: PhpK family radical SAM P-methyltransferase, partial [Cytophagales bacterium]|nr:PhpK family radical SAM P-methyltransferase [Cytophagales bacterium]
IRAYGEYSEAFRDLQTSFITLKGKPRLYTHLLAEAFDEEFKSGDIPNLAAVYLSHFLIKKGFAVDYINLFQEEKEKFAQMLLDDPVCVAITTTFYVINFPVTEMIKFIRKYNATVPIIVGGVLITNHHNTYDEEGFQASLRDIGADIYVLESQGESTLDQLVGALKRGDRLETVPNLYYFRENELCKTSRVVENNSLDVNSIDWGVFKGKDLGSTIQTRTARSCAFACAFCGYPERGGPLTLAGIDTVAAELESIRSLGGVQNVVFIDDTFNVPKARFKEFCRMLIEKKFNFNWFSYYRCDHGDEEAIDLMQQSGCKGVFLGIESGSQEILLKMNKRAQVKNYERGIKALKERGILTFTSLITGYPGESESTIKETIDFLKATEPDYWRTQLWYCDPLTPVYKTKKEEFRISGEGFRWEHYTMDSGEAIDWIEEMFLQVKSAVWLPQHSFDFWIIPYIMGKGVSLPEFKEFMKTAYKLLSLEVACLDEEEKSFMQHRLLGEIRDKNRYQSIKNSLAVKPRMEAFEHMLP